MYALQQVKNGQREGKVWIFSTRKLAQESVAKTYVTQEPDALMQTTVQINTNFVRINTNYMGTLYFAINELVPNDEAIFLS